MKSRRHLWLPLFALFISLALHLGAALGDTLYLLWQAATEAQDSPDLHAAHHKLQAQDLDKAHPVLPGVRPAGTFLIYLSHPAPVAEPPIIDAAANPAASVGPSSPTRAKSKKTENVVKPAIAAQLKPVDKPVTDTKPVVIAMANTPLPPTAAPPIVETPPPAAPPGPTAAVPATPPATKPSAELALKPEAFPRSIAITYFIKGLVSADHRVNIEGDHYRIVTKGNLLHLGTFEMRSEGSVSGKGLRPSHYVTYINDNPEPRYEVNFDWDAHVARFGNNAFEKEAVLDENAQDIFSAAYQFALLGDKIPSATLQIFNGRKDYRVAFALKGEADLSLSGQKVPTLVLGGTIDDKRLDFYLAPQWHNVPVRMHASFGGQDVDLVAVQIVIDGKTLLEQTARHMHD